MRNRDEEETEKHCKIQNRKRKIDGRKRGVASS